MLIPYIINIYGVNPYEIRGMHLSYLSGLAGGGGEKVKSKKLKME
jgi:hypothetical protein